MTIVRAASEKPGRVTMTRYVPGAGASSWNRPSAPVSVADSWPVATPRSDDVTTRQRGAGHIGDDAAHGGGERRRGRQNGRNEYRQALNE